MARSCGLASGDFESGYGDGKLWRWLGEFATGDISLIPGGELTPLNASVLLLPAPVTEACEFAFPVLIKIQA